MKALSDQAIHPNITTKNIGIPGAAGQVTRFSDQDSQNFGRLQESSHNGLKVLRIGIGPGVLSQRS